MIFIIDIPFTSLYNYLRREKKWAGESFTAAKENMEFFKR